MVDLINANPDNIQLIRTTDNVDYIGKVTEELGKVKVEKCLHVFAHESQEENNRGNFQIGFMPPVHPALGTIDRQSRGSATIEFYVTALKFISPPNDEMVKMYRQAVSGIEIAKILPGKL